MKRTLAITALAFSLVAFGCDDDPDSGGGTGGRGGGGGSSTGGRGGTGAGGTSAGGSGVGGSSAGGTGGTAAGGSSGAGGGSAGAGGAGGGAGGSDAGGDTSSDVTGDTGGETGAAVDWTMCGASSTKPDVPAAEFCTKYMSACGFGAVMGRSAAQSFADMAACMTRYNGYNATVKGCTAYHLCVAAMPGMQAVHCPHPAQAAGPCNNPGL